MCHDSNRQRALPSSQQILAWILKATGVQAIKQASDREETLGPTTIIKAEKGESITENSWLQLVNEVVSALLNTEMNDEDQKEIIEFLRNWDLAVSKMSTCLEIKDRIPTILRCFLPEIAARIGILAALVQPYSTPALPLSTWLCDLLNSRIFGFVVEGLFVKCLPKLKTWSQRYTRLKKVGIDPSTVEDWRSEKIQVPHSENLESLKKLMPDHFQQQARSILRMARLLTRLQEDLRTWFNDELLNDELLNQARKRFKDIAENVRDNLFNGNYFINLPILWNELTKQSFSNLQDSSHQMEDAIESYKNTKILPNIIQSLFAHLIASPKQILPILSFLNNNDLMSIFLFREFSLFDRIQTELTLIYLAKETTSGKEIQISTNNCKRSWLPRDKERENAQKLLNELQCIDPIPQESQTTTEDSIINTLNMFGFLFENSLTENCLIVEHFVGIFNTIQIPSEMESILNDEIVRQLPHIIMARTERLASEGKYLDALNYISLIKERDHKRIANFDRRCAQFFINYAHWFVDELHQYLKIVSENSLDHFPPLFSKIAIFLNQADNIWFAPQNSSEELEKLSIMIPIAMRIDILSRSAQEAPDANSWPQSQRFGERLESYQEISNGPACAALALWQKENRKKYKKTLKRARRLGSSNIYDLEINRLRW